MAQPGALLRQALRALVEHQLELVRRMHQRHELVSERRAHLFYLMRGLWAQLCLWRSALDREPAGAIRSRDQVRGLCAEIDREFQDETRELVRQASYPAGSYSGATGSTDKP